MTRRTAGDAYSEHAGYQKMENRLRITPETRGNANTVIRNTNVAPVALADNGHLPSHPAKGAKFVAVGWCAETRLEAVYWVVVVTREATSWPGQEPVDRAVVMRQICPCASSMPCQVAEAQMFSR